MMIDHSSSPASAATIALVGLGNIGSFLAGLAATILHALPAARRTLILIDGDDYDASNFATQHLVSRDQIGRPKAEAQAAALRERFPALTIIAESRWLEEVPLGRLRQADILVGALDSKLARQSAGRRACRLGIPFLDTGVDPEPDPLARVSAFDPGNGTACVECRWGAGDYADIQTLRSCTGGRVPAPPTAAPAWLGSLAASLAAPRLEALLSAAAGSRGFADSREILFAPTAGSVIEGRIAANPDCRFDHAALPPVEIADDPPEALTLARLFDSAGGENGAPPVKLSIPENSFTLELACPACASRVRRPGLAARPPVTGARCEDCGGDLLSLGFEVRDEVGRADFDDSELALPLSRFGFEPGDFISVRSDGPLRCLELPGLSQ